jgi:hypothetical protein
MEAASGCTRTRENRGEFVSNDERPLAQGLGWYVTDHRGIRLLWPEGDRSELFAETPTQFFLKRRQWTMTFVREGKRVVRIDIGDAGEIVQAPKIE